MVKDSVFIDGSLIEQQLLSGSSLTERAQVALVEKIERGESLTSCEIASLLYIVDPALWERLHSKAGEIKRSIYGDRIVVFAPLYVSNYCVNNCTYCGYRRENTLTRKKLTMDQIRSEVEILEKMGHKRLALELGEDDRHCPIEYVEEVLDTIYGVKTFAGEIRRVNVNIAATSVENYARLKAKGIGTYILFQETYHQPTYSQVHPRSVKGDYSYHLNAFTRAMNAGVDDVGAGILLGLYHWRFELMALLQHNDFLESSFGVGFHTVSIPRLKPASGISLSDFPYMVGDEDMKKIVTVLRIALPFVGIILSTREGKELRKELVRYGVSQVSAGSSTGVGGYKAGQESENTEQFEVEDARPAAEIIKELIEEGYLPSYCTACYRSGRTGDRFMKLAKSGNIQNVCQPNALMTLMEYAVHYGDKTLIDQVRLVCQRELPSIQNDKIRAYTAESLLKIEKGERDFFV